MCAGRTFVSFIILIGVVFLAMPLSTVGNNFTSVWEERQLYRLQVQAASTRSSTLATATLA